MSATWPQADPIGARWEVVDRGLERIKVPGGWLYRSCWTDFVTVGGGSTSVQRYSTPVFVEHMQAVR